jgi:hypothetical protein
MGGKPRGGALATVRALALALPETLERPCYGTPGFYVRRTLFARLLEDGGSLMVRCERERRDALVGAAPEVFVVTPHYAPHAAVVVRLAAASRAVLADALEEAWRLAATPTLRRAR